MLLQRLGFAVGPSPSDQEETSKEGNNASAKRAAPDDVQFRPQRAFCLTH
jgi:hypothetical protein